MISEKNLEKNSINDQWKVVSSGHKKNENMVVQIFFCYNFYLIVQ